MAPGKEKAFEKGAIKTMDALPDSTGFLGYMILKQIGVCALGSFMLDPVSMAETHLLHGPQREQYENPSLDKLADLSPSKSLARLEAALQSAQETRNWIRFIAMVTFWQTKESMANFLFSRNKIGHG